MSGAPLSGHDELRESLADAALGALAADEQARVEAPAAACAACGPELAAYRATAARLPEAAPALDPAASGAVRARLLARARAGAASPPAVRALPARARLRVAPWLAAAAAIAALAAGLEVVRLREALVERDRLAAEGAAQLATLRTAVADREQALARLTGPDVRVVELASARSSSPTARMFWDRASDSWLFFAHRLPPARPGRTYQLWLVTPTAKISAGTFDTTPTGDGALRTRYPLKPADLQAVAVTEEPAGGVPVATGEIVLLGAAGGR